MIRGSLLALLVIALLAGCGGSGDEGDGAATRAATGGTATSGTETAVDEATTQRVKELMPLARRSQVGVSIKESLRIADAQDKLLTIAAENPAAIQPLLAALEKPDYGQIIDMYSFYIQLGKPGSEKVLREALLRLEPSPPNEAVVLEFARSGNGKLLAAARKWAADNGYRLTGQPGEALGGWGSAGVYGPGGPPGAPAPSGP